MRADSPEVSSLHNIMRQVSPLVFLFYSLRTLVGRRTEAPFRLGHISNCHQPVVLTMTESPPLCRGDRR